MSISVAFDSDCMKAMCIADSGCVRTGCARDIFNRLGCGYFRMNIWQFKVDFISLFNAFYFSNAMSLGVESVKTQKMHGFDVRKTLNALRIALR